MENHSSSDVHSSSSPAKLCINSQSIIDIGSKKKTGELKTTAAHLTKEPKVPSTSYQENHRSKQLQQIESEAAFNDLTAATLRKLPLEAQEKQRTESLRLSTMQNDTINAARNQHLYNQVLKAITKPLKPPSGNP